MNQHKYFNIDEHSKINNIILERYKNKNFNYEKKNFDNLINLAKERLINDKNKELDTKIPIITMDNKDLFYNYYQKKEPVILRGFVNDNILKEYTFDKIIEKYGSHNVRFTNENREYSYKKLNLMKENKNNEYIHNCSLITGLYPNILEDLNLIEIPNIVKDDSIRIFNSQFFIGNSEKIKQKLINLIHCAKTPNLFIILDGNKKWTFIDPKWSNLLPMNLDNNDCIRWVLDNKNELLFNHIPKKIGTIKKGDLLFVPSYYWHGVENINKKTIGIANRLRSKNFKINTIMNMCSNESIESKELEFNLAMKIIINSIDRKNSNTFIQNKIYKNEDEFYNELNNVEYFNKAKNN
jgi:hypothetical protein